MMGLKSLRWRILFGAVLWTAGLLPLSHLLFVLSVMQKHQRSQLLYVGPHFIWIAAVLFLVAGFMQVRSGLMPFGRLRDRLLAVSDGRESRVEGTYPAEIQPLVNDLNSLLDHREKAVQRALAKAGDLAHGLKTPLTILAQEADRTEGEGHQEVA